MTIGFAHSVTFSELRLPKNTVKVRQVLLYGFLLLCLFFVQGDFSAFSQQASQSTLISSVPSWFSYCAGENGQCSFTGPAQIIYGSSTGNAPSSASNAGFYSQTLTNGATCSNRAFGDPAAGQSKACWFGPTPNLGHGSITSVGGSNYPFYVQNFQQWDNNQRVVVGLYHLAPTMVESQLRQIHKSGQDKIALFIWYMPFESSMSPGNGVQTIWPDVWGAYLNSSSGQLSAQAQQNLTAILGLVKSVGFKEVTLRFAPVGAAADPCLWGNTWNETGFEQDEAFLFNTRKLTESVLAGSSVQRFYDLGVEKVGIPHNLNSDGITFSDGQTPAWTTRLWTDYVKRFGTADSYGFSIAYSSGTIRRAIAEFDHAGIRPKTYAIDTYVTSDLWPIYQELYAAGDATKPIIIQETQYNNASEMQAIQTALQHIPLTISYIDQWPISSTDPTANNITPPTNYGFYRGTKVPSGNIVAHPCTLTQGQSTCLMNVGWSTSNASDVKLFINGLPAVNLPNVLTMLSGSATITLSQSSTSLQLFSAQGILTDRNSHQVSSVPRAPSETIISPLQSTAPSDTLLDQKTFTAIDPSAPSLTIAGLGGIANQAIWATGENISQTCMVNLYDPNAVNSAPIATINTASCQSSNLSFAIPSAVLNNYAEVWITVSNPNGRSSQPIFVQIHSFPVLSIAGLGGDQNTAIWAMGSNFSSNCSVNLYDQSAPNPVLLQTIKDIGCQANSFSFVLPAHILANYESVSMTVTNPSDESSALLGVKIREF